MRIKQRIKDDLYTQWKWAGRQGIAKRLGNHLRAKGIDVLTQLLAVIKECQALFQSKQ